MKAIGISEFNSIPVGMLELDNLLKNFNLEIYKGGVTCPGKYYFIVHGDNYDIEEGIKNIKSKNKSTVISKVSSKVVEALKTKLVKSNYPAVGIFEFYDIAEGVKALDHVIKSVDIDILKLVLGITIAGKSYFVLGGDTSSIEEAVVLVTGSYNYKDAKIVNNPEKELLKFI
nr:BMC domain-containing protein [uncultured Cetobacterium sp.]